MTRMFVSAICKVVLAWACLFVDSSLAAETQGLFTGRLEVLQEDDFTAGTTKRMHFLHESVTGKTYRLVFEKEPAAKSLLSGATVVVHGTFTDDREAIRLESSSGISVTQQTAVVADVDRTALVIIVDFQDAPVSCSDASVADMMFTGTSSVDGLYQDTSFGAISFPSDTDGDGSPDVIRVSISAAAADSCDAWGWAAEADAAVTSAQVDLNLYQHRVYALPRESSCPWTGLANVGCGGFCRAFSRRCYYADVYAHELGHNLNLQHSATDLDNNGTIDCEYCDTSDFMGLSGRGWRQVNGPHKYQKGWLPPEQVVDINPGPSDTHLIAPLELDPSVAAYPQLLRIPLPDGDYYYVSYRRPIGYDQGLDSDYSEKTNIHSSSASGASKSLFIVALADGEVFQDGEISITQVSHDTNAVTLLIQGQGQGCSDVDSDGVCGDIDNCPNVANSSQLDTDGDDFGDACDACPYDANNDADGDGLCGDADNCPADPNPNQENADADELGDACDACPNDPDNNIDGDNHCGDVDNCPGVANNNQKDSDGDGIGDACDPCQGGTTSEVDESLMLGKTDSMTALLSWDDQGVPGEFRLYRGFRNFEDPFVYNTSCVGEPISATQTTDPDVPAWGRVLYYLIARADVCGESGLGIDWDGVARPKVETCAVPGPYTDGDADGTVEALDICPGLFDPTQSDADSDDRGDICDTCPDTFNPSQDDLDDDGAGDVCDPDRDGDGVPNADDNCPDTINNSQDDVDADGVGDACDGNVCGDGDPDLGEQCDDGNPISGDGCFHCMLE